MDKLLGRFLIITLRFLPFSSGSYFSKEIAPAELVVAQIANRKSQIKNRQSRPSHSRDAGFPRSASFVHDARDHFGCMFLSL
jgi:hypothetical protein